MPLLLDFRSDKNASLFPTFIDQHQHLAILSEGALTENDYRDLERKGLDLAC